MQIAALYVGGRCARGQAVLLVSRSQVKLDALATRTSAPSLSSFLLICERMSSLATGTTGSAVRPQAAELRSEFNADVPDRRACTYLTPFVSENGAIASPLFSLSLSDQTRRRSRRSPSTSPQATPRPSTQRDSPPRSSASPRTATGRTSASSRAARVLETRRVVASPDKVQALRPVGVRAPLSCAFWGLPLVRSLSLSLTCRRCLCLSPRR